LTDDLRGIADRLYHCQYSKCGKFGFDSRPDKGPHVQYCPGTNHAGAARQAAKRLRDRDAAKHK